MEEFDTYIRNPNQDLVLQSSVPDVCKEQHVMMGIDEAGRGPVLGPMVYAVAFFPISASKDMMKMEFADSKILTEAKREEIFNSLPTKCLELGWKAKILSPFTISTTSFRRRKYNLNQLSHDTAMELVQKCIDQGIKVKELYVDTVGPPEKYRKKLEEAFPLIPTIKVEKKADSKFHVVSAASICAKVIRDRALGNWRFPEEDVIENVEKGSGYPGDDVTKKFLKKVFDPVFGFPSLVRFCWSTAKTIIEKDGVDCKWEECDEEDEIGEFDDEDQPKRKKKTQVKHLPITQFLKRSACDAQETPSKRTKTGRMKKDIQFFSDRQMKRVESINEVF